jgi:hypothetical protein
MSVSYPPSTRLLLCIQSTSSHTPECFHFQPLNNSLAKWWCTPDRRCLYRMLWGKPLAEWCSPAKFGSHVSLFLVPIFGVNICPFNYGIKDDFISELTINTRHPQAKYFQHPFFPPSNRWSLRLDPNPSSSIFPSFNLQMVNPEQALQVNLILLKHIRYYISRIPSQIFLSPSFVLDRLYPSKFWFPLKTEQHLISLGP